MTVCWKDMKKVLAEGIKKVLLTPLSPKQQKMLNTPVYHWFGPNKTKRKKMPFIDFLISESISGVHSLNETRSFHATFCVKRLKKFTGSTYVGHFVDEMESIKRTWLIAKLAMISQTIEARGDVTISFNLLPVS